MNINTILIKSDVINEDLGNESILLNSDNIMFTLNPIAKYIWENCHGKSVKDLSKQIYDTCINKEELCLDDIQKDCIDVLEEMLQQGFIKLKG